MTFEDVGSLVVSSMENRVSNVFKILAEAICIHFTLMSLGKAWIHFSLQLWVNSKAFEALEPS